MEEKRDFSTISPSARSLILLKGYTDIPYAKEIAGLLESTNSFGEDSSTKDVSFWARTYHFEKRYKSIDQLLNKLSVKNVLEISSGYSLRGLDTAIKSRVHYIDTDLKEVINAKKEMVAALGYDTSKTKGTVSFCPLNVLDEEQFQEVVNKFPAGEIAIINEGLLMYLNDREKRLVCENILNILKKRGGYWITGDIYFKGSQKRIDLKQDSKIVDFFNLHQIEENKFEDEQTAEAFFTEMGFVLEGEAELFKEEMGSWKDLYKSLQESQQVIDFSGKANNQRTWCLRVKP